MSYSRMEIIDNETIIDKKLIDNLQDGLDDLYGNRQVASYSSIKQVGLDVGAETLVDIVTVLPDASQLLTAVDETHNVQEYPHPNGNLLIECTKKGYGRAKFWVTVEGVPRIWNGVIEDGEWKGWIEDFNSANLTPEKIGASTVEYVDQQILRITETGIPKLMVYPLSSVATEEGQTTFDINLNTFDKNTDTVFVQSGRTMLSPNLDFSVEDNKVVLKEGVQKGRTVEIYVFKNVPLGEEGSVSGIVLAPNSIPLNRLEVMPATPDYVDQQIAKSAETGVPKLMVYPLSQVSTTDNQTVFNITLNTFDSSTDTVLVQSGRTMLFPNEDFSVVDKTIVLNEGVPKDVTIGIYIFKNVPLGEDGSVSGVVISPKSLPLDRLAQMPTAYDLSIPVNNNILINSNFANPVNQRGVVSGVRSNHEYTIDRWKVNANTNFTINENESISISGSNGNSGYLYQRIEDTHMLDGKTVTFSSKVNGTIYSKTGILEANKDNSPYLMMNTDFGAMYITYTAEGIFQPTFVVGATRTATIEWAKLELGDHATPYVPRLYAEELELCMKYYQLIPRTVLRAIFNSNNLISFGGTFPCKMRKNGTVLIPSKCTIQKNGADQTGWTFTGSCGDADMVINASKSNHGISNADMFSLLLSNNIAVDAEL